MSANRFPLPLSSQVNQLLMIYTWFSLPCRWNLPADPSILIRLLLPMICRLIWEEVMAMVLSLVLRMMR